MIAGGGGGSFSLVEVEGILDMNEMRDFSRSRCSRMMERTRVSLYLRRVSV